MKAITLWQPWASLITVGAKRIETRSWYTSYRGPLAIHACKATPRWVDCIVGASPFRVYLEAALGYVQVNLAGHVRMQQFPSGVMLAICTLMDCVPPETLEITEQERCFGDYGPGRFAWILDDIKPLNPPVKAVGKQGLWEWDEHRPLTEASR